MKRILLCILSITILFSACGNQVIPQNEPNAPTWQEQYDQGIRYLSEGNYEEAIIAFTAAIEIDPKQTLAYVGRGDAYVQIGETEENLAAAQADYEMAIELDELLVEAYLGLADVYIQQEDLDKAKEILQSGIDNIEDPRLSKQLEEIMFLDDNFLNNQAFFVFEDLENPVQILIEKLENSCTNDMNTATELLTTAYVDMVNQGTIDKELRTIKDGKKIQVSYLQWNDVIVGGSFEIRPLSGTAYYCNAQIRDGLLHFQYVSGNCENWNWNGAFERTATVSDGYVYYESGNCVDGLRNGPVLHWLSQEYIDAYPNSINNYNIYYDMGKEIKTVYSDGFERPTDANQYSEDDVFIFLGRTHINNYKYLWLW